jgi:hypothetical protein
MPLRNLIVEPSPKTPKILWNVDSYTFRIEGRSIPEDSVGFYKKLYAWVEDCGPDLNGTVSFEFQLEYFNTSTSKCLLDLFKMLQKHWERNNQISIKWYFAEDDPDMGETGRDYADLLDLPFEVIEVSE